MLVMEKKGLVDVKKEERNNSVSVVKEDGLNKSVLESTALPVQPVDNEPVVIKIRRNMVSSVDMETLRRFVSNNKYKVEYIE